MTAELSDRVADLLREARLKRSAASIAMGASDDAAAQSLKDEAKVREGAAEYLDPAHLLDCWKTEQ
jgi:hypothetical protein